MQSNITTCNTFFAHVSTNTGFGLHPSNWEEACGDTGYLPSPTLWLSCASLPRRTTSKFSVLVCIARVTAAHVIGHQLHSRFHLRAVCVCVCVCVRMPFGQISEYQSPIHRHFTPIYHHSWVVYLASLTRTLTQSSRIFVPSLFTLHLSAIGSWVVSTVYKNGGIRKQIAEENT